MQDDVWRQIPIVQQQLQSLPECLPSRHLISFLHCEAAGKRMLHRPPSIIDASDNTYDTEKN